MKRIILGILCVLISINAFSVSADFYVNGIGYTVLSFSGDLTCELSDGTACSGDITIPETVTYQGRTLKVIMIDNGAFAGTPVTSVILSKSIRSIGRQAFGRCNKLKTITIPESCDDYDSAFENCTSLISVVILSDHISSYAFRDCSSLREINFPSSITEIKAGAFQSCLSLQVADLSQTKLTILESNLFLNSSSLTKAVLPETVTTIKNNSFGDCYALKEVNLPSKLVRIWPAAFIKCKSLEKISLPGTLVNMYHYTFGDCTSLKDVEYLGNNPSAITVQRGGVFDGYTENSTPVNLYLPNVASDPKDGSWNNFLGYDWSKQTIHYGTSMPK